MCITVFTRAPNDNSGKGKRGRSDDDVAVKELEGLNVSTYRRDRSTILNEFQTLKMWTASAIIVIQKKGKLVPLQARGAQRVPGNYDSQIT